MPISFEKFKKIQQEEPADDERPILDFLKKNKEKAFMVRELERKLPLTRRSIGSKLFKLWQRGYVTHKRPYWAYHEE